MQKNFPDYSRRFSFIFALFTFLFFACGEKERQEKIVISLQETAAPSKPKEPSEEKKKAMVREKLTAQPVRVEKTEAERTTVPDIPYLVPVQSKQMSEKKETAAEGKDSPPAQPKIKVNINTASVNELMTVPGIGKVLATRIVEYRTEHGGFASVEELRRVQGIDKGLLEGISDFLSVE